MAEIQVFDTIIPTVINIFFKSFQRIPVSLHHYMGETLDIHAP